MAPESSLLEGSTVPVLVALAFVGAAAYIFMRDQSGDLRAMLSAAPSPVNSLKLARAIARMYGSELAQCIDFKLTPPRLRLHEGQAEACASKLRKLARFGPSDSELEHSLSRVLGEMVSLSALTAEADGLRRTTVSATNATHEAALEALWDALQPGRARDGGRISKSWGDIGFQGSDPTTDFRGMGFFALLSLLHTARAHPAFCARHVRTYMTPGNELTYFPFAITSINVTGWLLDMLGAGELDLVILTTGARLETLHEVHFALFVHFARAWERERPKSVMEFGRVQKAVLAEVKRVGIERLLDAAAACGE
ncbi:hypothetical protein KFE25_014088 [Diacronema lutheri]|mgnify:CR=1 FL=1|uniref:ELMO domain-containing protein n=2 Tax=Diacronema lutheri TaxID=2081491 RepID=A0A8J6C193_DIALT|nr:hypothetical protein KFE25_014088 [Diacronema lutheri]